MRIKKFKRGIREKNEELFYVKKEEENLENWVAETNEFENIIIHEIRDIREVHIVMQWNNSFYNNNVIFGVVFYSI